jgi:hypothetical protein
VILLEEKLSIYKQIGLEIGELVEIKQRAYGDSFSKCGEFLKLLYPNGVQPDQYQDMLTIVRIFDKLMRIATDKDALGESPYRDIVGYGLLAVAAQESKQGDKNGETTEVQNMSAN